MEGLSIEFADDTLDYIVDKAMEYKLGARGLRSICEVIMTDIMYEMPSTPDVKELTIEKTYAEEKINKSALHQLKVA